MEADEDLKVSYNTRFITNDETSCGRLWGAFNSRGEIRDADIPDAPAPVGSSIGAALCVKVILNDCASSPFTTIP